MSLLLSVCFDFLLCLLSFRVGFSESSSLAVLRMWELCRAEERSGCEVSCTIALETNERTVSSAGSASVLWGGGGSKVSCLGLKC